MKLVRGWLGRGLLILATACASKAGPIRAPAAAAETEAQPRCRPAACLERDGFVYARPSQTSLSLPSRFEAAPPSSLDELEKPLTYPPRAQLRRALCRGEASTQGRYLASLRKAASNGPLPEDLRDYFASLFGYCDSDALCSWVASTLPSEKAAPARQVLFHGLVRCGTRGLAALDAPDSPDEIVLEAYLNAHGEKLPFSARLQAAIRAQAAKLRGRALRWAGVGLVNVDDVQAVPFIQELQANTDPESAAWLAIGLDEHMSPAAKELFKKACQHPEVAPDPMCSERQLLPTVRAPHGSLAARVDAGDIDIREWLQTNPQRRPELLAALTTCTEHASEPYRRAHCLDDLAALDWRVARTQVQKLGRPGIEKLPYGYDLVTALARFESSAQLVEHLRQVALLPAGAALDVQSLESAPTAAAILTAAARVHCFDAETDQFPNEHDDLLRDLAELAGGDLTSVAFEELPPAALPDGSDTGKPYVLNAYVAGMRYTVHAANLGDWFDVEAVLGLLNSLLRERGSDQRFTSLFTGDQTACLVLGPRGALKAAIESGLLIAGNAEEAEANGKRAEEALFRMLEREP